MGYRLAGCYVAAGHTSWTTSGLAYLSLWLAGKLRVFDGGGHPWKAVVSIIPTGVAMWIGITRLQVAGLLLFITHAAAQTTPFCESRLSTVHPEGLNISEAWNTSMHKKWL